MTIGSPRRFFSNSRGRVIGRREASAGVWMFGCALMATQPPGCPLALRIGVVDETGAAHAGRDGDEHCAVDARHGARGRLDGRARRTRARRRARASRPARPRAATSASRSPALSDASAAASASCSASARSRSAPCRWTLRLESARPSGSRTVGQTSMRTGRSRSRTSARTTSACWASFWPKYATSGPTMFSSLVTTVVTPSKWLDAAMLALERLGQAGSHGPSSRSPADRPRRAPGRRAGRRRPRRPARHRAPRRAGRRPDRRSR